MFQLCHAIQYMHKNSVGCFVRPSDVIVDEHFKVKIKNLHHTYAVDPKTGWKGNSKSSSTQANNQPDQPLKLDVDYEENKIEFPYINIGSGL